MDGKAGKEVRSEIHSPGSHGVNSVVWVQERAGHKSQGSSPRPKHPITSPRFWHQMQGTAELRPCGKERFIGTRPQGALPPHPEIREQQLG
jgi:hypothetical protein